MKRTSYYISADAADALDAAVEQVVSALGGGVPKHMALSALIAAGAAKVSEVTAELADAQARELAERLDALRRSTSR